MTTGGGGREIRGSVRSLAALFVCIVVGVIWVGVSETPFTSGTSADPAEQTGRGNSSARAGRGDRAQAGNAQTRASGAYTHHNWGEESELTRLRSLGLPGPGFWQRYASQPPDDDPQLAAMWRSFHGAVGEEGGDPPLHFEPTARRARLIEAEGDVDAAPTNCDVRVLPVRSSNFNCMVRVMCDGRVLYPNDSQSAGYVPCDMEDGRPIGAVDDGSTARDGDPLVNLDLRNGTVTVEDFDAQGIRRYRATLRLDG